MSTRRNTVIRILVAVSHPSLNLMFTEYLAFQMGLISIIFLVLLQHPAG